MRYAATALLAALAVWARATRGRTATPSLPAREARRVVTDDGVALHVEVEGPESDVTVVLVHGLLARCGEWDLQWAALRDSTRVVRFDHAGHGLSAGRRGPAHIDRLARDLDCVLSDAAPGPVVLVGHSMGGMTVLAHAAAHPALYPDRVRGVVLVGTGAGHDIARHPVENAVRLLARMRVLGPLLLLLRTAAPVLERLRPRGSAPLRHATRWLSFGSTDAAPGLVAAVQAMLEEPPLPVLASLLGTIARVDERASLPVLRQVPVEVLAGEDDRLTRVGHSRAIAADLGPAASLVVVPGAGHVLPRSHPAEVSAAIARVVSRARVADVVVSPGRGG